MSLDLDAFLRQPRPEGIAPVLQPGMRVERWTVTGRLGRGGCGEVYRAVDGTDEAVAIKVLHRTDAAARARFRAEADLLAAGGIPALPRFRSRGVVSGRPYVVMELLEPCELPESERAIARYLLDVCAAVAELHARGIVHRDLKPANVMRRAAGGVVLVDVGLAKDVGVSSRPRTDVTVFGGKLAAGGTPGYAAPEQFDGGEITVRTDVHAIGRLAYTAFQVRAEARGVPFTEREVPRRWRPILTRATSSIPDQRYGSADALARAIRRRGLKGWMAGGACVGALALAAGLAAFPSWRTEPVAAGESAEDVVLRDEMRRWSALCRPGETNETVRIPLGLRTVTNRVTGKVMSGEAHSNVVRRLEVVFVDLARTTQTFTRPVRLEDGRVYVVRGPGRLDADFAADGTNTTVWLDGCDVNNLTRTPVGKGGIRYRLTGRRTYLNFPNLKRPLPGPDCLSERIDGDCQAIAFGGPPTWADHALKLQEEARRRLLEEARW